MGDRPGVISVGPGSAWLTEDEHGYALTDFYTRSVDSHGHSSLSTRIRLRPEIANEIAALVARRTIPSYRTSADFIRDAIVHRLHWIAQVEKDPALRDRLNESTHRIAMEETAASYEAELDNSDELYRRVQQTADKAIRMGDFGALATFTSSMRERAGSMRDPFRRRIFALLNEVDSRMAQANANA